MKLIKRKYKVIIRRYFYLTKTGYYEDAKIVHTDTVVKITKHRFEAEQYYNQATACHYQEGTTYKGIYYPNVMIILQNSKGEFVKWQD